MRDVVDKAHLLVDRVNQALRFAEEVENLQMRAVRARAAARALDELRELVGSHQGLRLERLEAVETRIAELLGAAGPHVPLAHSGDPLGSARANSDLVKGLEFHATLQLRTPLSVLKHHGKIHKSLKKPPPGYAKEQWHGIWLPLLKSWKELGGADVPDWRPSTVATDLGPMADRGEAYFRYLMAIRTVAADRSIPRSERRVAVADEAAKPEWARFTEGHGGPEEVARKVMETL